MRGAFDLETFIWKPNQPIRPFAAGAIVGVPGFRPANHFQIDRKNPQRLLENLLAFMFQSGCTEWWAHNGSRFDVLFLCNAARKMGLEQNATMNKTGKPIDWRIQWAGKVIHCLDTTNLVPAKLKDIAVDFELPSRKSFTISDYESDLSKLPDNQVREGCLTDCHLVLELLGKLEGMVQNFGLSKLRHTTAGNALAMFESTLREKRVPTHCVVKYNPRYAKGSFERELYGPGGEQLKNLYVVNHLCKQAYFGGRVEIFHHRPHGLLREYDINSSYPAAMLRNLPWEYRASKLDRPAQWAFDNGDEGIFEATVTVASDCYLPPLPFLRKGEALFFPTGTWHGTFAGNELRYALRHGVTSCKVDWAWVYTRARKFRRFITEMYHMKQSGTGAIRQFGKLILNSCYGKFAQGDGVSNLKIFRNYDEVWTYSKEHPKVEVAPLNRRGAVMLTTNFQPRYQHYALASYITAGARIALHRKLVSAERPVYCDSDSIHCAGEFETSTELGGLKLVRENFRGLYYAPKIYELRLADGTSHFVSKGFTVGEEEFRALVKGLGVKMERVRQIKSQLKAGDLEVMRLQEFKSWAGVSNKRAPFPDGSTRPWSVKELEAGAHHKIASPIREFV